LDDDDPPSNRLGTIPLDQVAAPPVVKPRPCPFSAQTIEKTTQHFFPKFADYFSPFAILEVV
jgi:hypothetical protein